MKTALILFALLSLASGIAAAQTGKTIEEAATDSVVRWLPNNSVRLNLVEAGKSFTNMQPLKNMIGEAHFEALGKPTQVNREFFQLTYRMIEFLIAEPGFNFFAVESPLTETFDLNKYILKPAKPLDGEELAKQVTIYRDAYGIPHVHGETDAAAVFGFMYAQAEDNLQAIEQTVLNGIGRLAELEGEKGYVHDLHMRALETERLSHAEYENAPPQFRALADAWADGLNYYREQNQVSDTSPIERFEPWHVFAVGRLLAAYVPPLLAPEQPRREELININARASNMWMLGPGKSTSGNAMLLINPHISTSQVLGTGEAHLVSDEGLNIYGWFYFGNIFPVAGHTPHHGWAVTFNFSDVMDLWELTFDHPTDSLAYRYGDDYRKADLWTEKIRVATDTGLVTRNVRFRKSHHGPIVANRNGKPIAMRIARYEDGGYYQQLYAMAKARSLKDFQAAVGRNRFLNHNLGYADREGNIWYVYNGPVPRRSEQFDWSQPVDGSNPETEWQGYHSLEELPQVLNPKSGWILNTNSSPFAATSGEENPDPDKYPDYMVGESNGNPIYEEFASEWAAARYRVLRQTNEENGRFDFNEFSEAATQKRVHQADIDIPAIADEWEALLEIDPARAEAIRAVVDTLRAWDRVSAMGSTAMTVYMHWSFAYREAPVGTYYYTLNPTQTDEWPRILALEKGVSRLKNEWGTVFVPWEEVNRLQRPVNGTFSDDRPSTAVAGGPGILGIIQEFHSMPVPGQKRWYGRHANSYVSIIEFGPEVRARTIMPFGQSSDPESPHYNDQSELYGLGKYKKAWTTLEEVKENAVRVYRPGEKPQY